MRPFRLLLEHPAYWSLNRRNVTRAFALGLLIAFIPIPMHLVLGASARAAPASQRAGSDRRHISRQSADDGADVPVGLLGRLPAARHSRTAYLVRDELGLAHDHAAAGLETVPAGLPGPGHAHRARGYILLGGIWHLSLVLKYHKRKGAAAPASSADADKCSDFSATCHHSASACAACALPARARASR